MKNNPTDWHQNSTGLHQYKYKIALIFCLVSFWLVSLASPIALATQPPVAGATQSPVAASSVWRGDAKSRVRLIAASETLQPINRLGVEFFVAPGWHFYWRLPGDLGLPPEFDWSKSTNVKSVTIRWPMPKLITENGLTVIGYDLPTILPLEIIAKDQTQPMKLRLDVFYGACSDICIPYKQSLELDIARQKTPPTTGPTMSEFDAVLRAAEAKVPQSVVAESLEIVSTNLVTNGGKNLHLEVSFRRPIAISTLIVSGFTNDRTGFIENRSGNKISIPIYGIQGETLVGKPLKLTLALTLAGEETNKSYRHFETTVVPLKLYENNINWFAPIDFGVLLTMILWAFLGGVILNLMPCVLPILSLKLMAALRLSALEQRQIRLEFLITALGIISSFLVLAIVLTLIKVGGGAVGWGIGFQQPWFLVIVIVILTGFGLSLLDFLPLRLPQFINRLILRESRHRQVNSFLTGAFATLLATPCTAPIIGTSLSFALSRSFTEILVIFLAMGIGFASPFLATAMMPRLVQFLPKPGKWMVWMKRVLAVMIFLTAIWFASIVASQVMPPQTSSPRQESQAPSEWQNFVSEGDIYNRVAQGQTVLLVVTADWCLACKINEKWVLETEEIRKFLAIHKITLIRADWTRPDATISDFMQSNHYYGVPLTLVYSPKQKTPRKLPEILTKNALKSAIMDSLK